MRVSLILLFLAALASCGSQDDLELTGVDWVVDYYTENGEQTVSPDVNYILNMNTSDYSFRMDVNTCFGTFTTSNKSQITYSSAGCTEICCDTEIAEKALELISTAEEYKIEGIELTLSGPKGEILLFTNQ
mgnify:CR=1 FL=1